MIRQFESRDPKKRRAQWPVVLALAFGGLLIAAGLFPFVEAHWDTLSPGARIAIVMPTLVALHTGAAFSLAKISGAGDDFACRRNGRLRRSIALVGQCSTWRSTS